MTRIVKYKDLRDALERENKAHREQLTSGNVFIRGRAKIRAKLKKNKGRRANGQASMESNVI